MDWDKASDLLSQQLDKEAVSKRTGGGGKELSYIEGWWAIAEANRIFGHGGWSRQTVELRLITEKPVGYFAKVRVTVGDVIRDGCGWGSDVRGDHEKALKEAETDATKRALMTFGWPLGLALYDKTQEMVSDSDSNSASTRLGPADFPREAGDPSARQSKGPFEILSDAMMKQHSWAELNKWWKASAKEIKQMNVQFQWDFFDKTVLRGLDLCQKKLEVELFWSFHEDRFNKLKEKDIVRYETLEEQMLNKIDKLNKREHEMAGA